jgi:hypothetical protein
VVTACGTHRAALTTVKWSIQPSIAVCLLEAVRKCGPPPPCCPPAIASRVCTPHLQSATSTTGKPPNASGPSRVGSSLSCPSWPSSPQPQVQIDGSACPNLHALFPWTVEPDTLVSPRLFGGASVRRWHGLAEELAPGHCHWHARPAGAGAGMTGGEVRRCSRRVQGKAPTGGEGGRQGMPVLYDAGGSGEAGGGGV